MATKKPTGVTVKIVKPDAYYQKDEPVDVGENVTVSKGEAAKLVARGIAEEK